MAILFFAVLTPAGLVLRLAGRDRLRRHPDRAAASYWIARGGAPDERRSAMTSQY
jgi:hypothetical protein